MRPVLVVTLLLLAGASQAQTLPAREPLDGRKNQRIERIRVEDQGARIDELRYGGETQSITVQPKANLPEYEVLPPGGGRGARPAEPREGAASATGARVWNVLRF